MKSYYGHGGPVGTHQRSFERYHPRHPKASLSQDWGFATPFQTWQVAYMHNCTLYRVHPNKSPLQILEKRERGRIQIF